MRENRTSGSGQGAPGNRRSYCETCLGLRFILRCILFLYRLGHYQYAYHRVIQVVQFLAAHASVEIDRVLLVLL